MVKPKRKLFRHGDVILMEVEGLPPDAKRRNHLVLAFGEATGHSHRIKESGAAELYEAAGQTYLKVIAQVATLVHDEHAAIPLSTGTYRFWRQREYAPDAIRVVRD